MVVAASKMPDELELEWRRLGLWQDLSLAQAMSGAATDWLMITAFRPGHPATSPERLA